MIPEFIPLKYRKPVNLAKLNYSKSDLQVAPQLIHSDCKPLIIGPMLDPVFVYLREHFTDRLHFVRWEDFRVTWDYRLQDGRLELIANGQAAAIESIYVRSCETTEDYEHREDLHILMQILATVRQRRLGTVDLGISNFSKILQLHGVIRKAAQGLATIAVPETLMIKSRKMTSDALADHMGASVAKSVSSTRTQVFDDRIYRHFRRHRPAVTPVLIQKKKVGMEIRVHRIGDDVFPLGIQKHGDQVDYRYDGDVDLIHDLELTADELAFCARVQQLERNPLIGLDLIRDNGVTYCFEANPNPGWACFEYHEETKRRLAETIVSYLEGK